MDGERFDELVRTLLIGVSRRGLLLRLSALPLAGGLAAFLLDDESEAKKRKHKNKKKRKKRKRKKRKKNAAACNGDVCAKGCPFTTVQDAIDVADAGDTITICAGTFIENLTIDKDLTLVGAGEDATTLQGDGAGTAVTIRAGTVRIEDLRITGGVAEFEGGGIYNESTLTLSGCTVTGNRTTSGDAYGNGIYNDRGVLTVEDCTISENGFDATGLSYGGGIYSEGTLTVTNSTFSGNRATIGGALYSNTPFGGGSATLTGCDFSDNVAVEHELEEARGGAIYANSELTLTVTDCTIRNNSAPDGGGAHLICPAVLTDCEISGNSASGDGGGILNFGGALTLDNTEVTGNSATNGGGIYNTFFDATVTCTNGSTVSGNTGGDCEDADGGSGCTTCAP